MKEYKVGYKYKVTEDGKELIGTITDINFEGYRVSWSDGSETLETYPDEVN